jgi:hypothetical protein
MVGFMFQVSGSVNLKLETYKPENLNLMRILTHKLNANKTDIFLRIIGQAFII